MTDGDLLSLSKNEFLRFKIVSSLRTLLADTAFHKIKVSDICRDADISRSSFYNLFDGVQDVADWEFGRLMDIASERHPVDSCSDWHTYFKYQLAEFLRLTEADAGLFKSIAKNMSRVEYDSIFERTRRRRIDFFKEALTTWQGEPPSELHAREIEFFVFAESDIIAKWFVTMEEPPDDVSTFLIHCIPEQLGKALAQSFEAYKLRHQDS